MDVNINLESKYFPNIDHKFVIACRTLGQYGISVDFLQDLKCLGSNKSVTRTFFRDTRN